MKQTVNVYSWHYSVCLYSDGCLRYVQNITQTKAGLFLDRKLTWDKQSTRPAVGHHNVGEKTDKQQETSKWSDTATVAGNAPLCRQRQLWGSVNLLIRCFKSQLYAFFMCEMCDSERE